nr:hypothetical protein [Tanacetum cinerariifolium]GEV64904.1 hypothetical protein [Tanacetum cinerariifolium]
MKEKVVHNNSQMKFKKTEVEDHHRIYSISNKTKSITACNDSIKSRTSNVNVVCATCRKCVFNSNHDACVSKFINDVNAKTKKPKVVPISTRKPKIQANKYVATPHKKTVASDLTIQKSKSYFRMLYEKTSKIVQLILFIVDSGCTKHMRGNLKLLCNFIEKYLGIVRFGYDQFAPILGYMDLVQGNIMIKRVYYVEDLNHNLLLVGQFCDADLEVAFWKSTCFVRDLHRNDLLTSNRVSDLYTISLKDTTSPTLICFMAKASPTQEWLCKEFKKKIVPSLKGRLNLLHMDLCGIMLIESINEKKYILATFSVPCALALIFSNNSRARQVKDEVYVAQPVGFVDPDHPEKVYSLRKALYGLKQAPRAWTSDPPIPKRYLYQSSQDSGFELTAFLDTDHIGCLDTRKRTSGGIQFLGDKLVSWMSKKQDCIAMSIAEAEYVNVNPPPTNNPPVLPTALCAMICQEPNELHKISTYINSRLENIDRFLNDFTQQPNEINVDDLDPDDESIDTPLVSPFLNSDDDSDDGEVLNELEEYGNAGQLCRQRAINSFDGDDFAFQCMIGLRKFVAYFDPYLPMNIIMRKAYNTIMVKGLEITGKSLVAIVRDVYVFVRSFTYITDFMILKDIGEFILRDMTKVDGQTL